MIDCQDSDRKSIVLLLAQNAALDASQTLLDHAIKTNNKGLLFDSQALIQNNLATNKTIACGCKDVYQSYIKTVQSVMAKGTPIKVSGGQCKIEDCPSCFWESICEREGTQKLLDRSRAVLEEAQRAIRESDARKQRLGDAS